MTLEEIKKQRVNLGTLGYRPAVSFNGRKAISYGMNGLGAAKHNYMTPNDALKSLWDVYLKGEYVATFKTEKAAMAFMERRDKEIEGVQFKSLLEKVNDLNKEMHAALVEFLKQHNGLVRTDTYGLDFKDKHLNPIYMISMDGDNEPNTEHRVLAVALFENDEVAVLPVLSENNYVKETLDAMTDEEVRDLDDWELIFGGYVLQNATLTALCEGIEEYV